jgi:hypothetical protein
VVGWEEGGREWREERRRRLLRPVLVSDTAVYVVHLRGEAV